MTDRFKAIAGLALLGCVSAGSLGYHEDWVQWSAIGIGAAVGLFARLA